ncbi:hypothetical protein ACVIHI_003046 [Bradyrhizobium sp. USDA 4524]|nr:hypothetical protein [Bradyrhizobium sp. USDA 4538]MCP1904601.1 hypothetical protein [Bradyrhizobium sp. USDA 4537]MCP1989743.1 hypothetical protein [Bradyrhizobium sp. USDA 4539]
MRFLRRDEIDAEFAAGRELGGGVGLAADPPGAGGAAAAREVGQALQRVRRIAKMAEQRCKGARARYYGANATSGLSAE